jgi:hypothetical protein
LKAKGLQIKVVKTNELAVVVCTVGGANDYLAGEARLRKRRRPGITGWFEPAIPGRRLCKKGSALI